MSGLDLIEAERERQVYSEHYSTEHDVNHHGNGELAVAAACYALPAWERESELDAHQHSDSVLWIPGLWPFNCEDWKPTPKNRIRELSKAGALIAAEIDRLLSEEAGAY